MTKFKHLFIPLTLLFGAAAVALVPTTASASPQSLAVGSSRAGSYCGGDGFIGGSGGGGGGGGSWGSTPTAYSQIQDNCHSHMICDGWYGPFCQLYMNYQDTSSVNGFLNGPHGGSTTALVTGISGVACTAIGTPFVGAACALVAAFGVSYAAEAFRYAVDNKRCVVAQLVKPGVPIFGGSIVSLGSYTGVGCK